MEDECSTLLTEAELSAAIERDDELGRLVARAFSFAVPSFSEVSGGFAPCERRLRG